jgi:cytochrome c-type biogenesis protein CcmE
MVYLFMKKSLVVSIVSFFSILLMIVSLNYYFSHLSVSSSELLKINSSGNSFNLKGVITPGSLRYADLKTAYFVVTDGETKILVRSDKGLPENIHENDEVMITGTITDEHVFSANKIGSIK